MVACVKRTAWALGIGLGLAAPAARADTYTPPTPDDPVFRKVENERRAGAVLGLAVGVGFAGASGYPNDVKLLGNPDYYSQTPLLIGPSTSIFLLGAVSDYLNFGPMVNIATFQNGTWKSTGFGVGLTLVDELWFGVEFKTHHYEENALGGPVSTYQTYSIGPMVGYKLFIWRGFFANGYVRYWPNVGTSLTDNKIALAGTNGTVTPSAHDFGLFANFALGYTLHR